MTPLDSDWLAANPLPDPGAVTDKNARGRVFVAGSSEKVPGAVLLTGEAALRAGAGKLQMASVAAVALHLGLRMPEAAVFPLSASPDGELGEASGGELLDYLDRCDALVLGPGMGAKAPAEAILASVLAGATYALTMVLDAAVIGAVAALGNAVRPQASRIVLTPHPGEMAQLMGCTAEQVEDEPEAIICAAADRFGATVLLKSAQTWIACPGETVLHYPGGGPGLATGGSGDVLAGIIGGLLARGAPPRVAAAWGVWLHGEAGRRLSERVGPLGFLARELLPEIPRLMALGR